MRELIEKWVLTSTALKRPDIRFIPRGIPQRNGDITQPAQMANTANGRTFRHFQEPGFTPGDLTIELEGAIPEEFRPLIGNRIYGCDDCQLICPWNRYSQLTDEEDFSRLKSSSSVSCE